jgi:cysteine desulfurase
LDEVIEAMARVSCEAYINPSSTVGTVVGTDRIRLQAAETMRQLVNAEEIDGFYFTSGATESNNWVMGPFARSSPSRTIIISDIEHPSVTAAAEVLMSEGFRILKTPVSGGGLLDLEELSQMLDGDVAIVSVMAANNETGVVQPMREIGRLIRTRSPGALFHSDATQTIGKMAIDLQGDWEDIDILSFSAHKFHGPKGIGGIYVRPGIAVRPFIHGGGQEGGLRSGTTNTPALAGLAVAAASARATIPFAPDLRDKFETELRMEFPSVVVHSVQAPRLPNTSCFSIPGIVASDIVYALADEQIVIGTGSACSAGAAKPPRTLLKMRVDYDLAASALRVSLGKFNCRADLSSLIAALVKHVKSSTYGGAKMSAGDDLPSSTDRRNRASQRLLISET